MPSIPTRMEFGFRGRIAMVTGAAGDIGWAIAKGFLEGGAVVLAIDRDTGVLKQRAGSLDDRAAERLLARTLDITDLTALQACVEGEIADLGGLDILVNNAAYEPLRASVDETEPAAWRATLNVNLDGAFLLSKVVLPVMRRQRSGVIINVASQLGHVSAPGSSAYSASKAALLALTRSIALDHAAEGIRAVSVSPGAVITGRLLRHFGSIDRIEEALVSRHPVGRLGSPEDVANAVLFLATEQAGFITGTDLLVDGGYTAQ